MAKVTLTIEEEQVEAIKNISHEGQNNIVYDSWKAELVSDWGLHHLGNPRAYQIVQQ